MLEWLFPFNVKRKGWLGRLLGGGDALDGCNVTLCCGGARSPADPYHLPTNPRVVESYLSLLRHSPHPTSGHQLRAEVFSQKFVSKECASRIPATTHLHQHRHHRHQPFLQHVNLVQTIAIKNAEFSAQLGNIFLGFT